MSLQITRRRGKVLTTCRGFLDRNPEHTIDIDWSPGYEGIKWNERADELAKAATEMWRTNETTTLTHARRVAKEKALARWTEKYKKTKPFLNDFLLDAIDLILPDLPNLGLTISTMFTAGWIHFTPEFHVGRTFDPLSPELRAILVIPSTNDANERTLGSHHP
ncbi:hypothetical protein C8J57DRAFT_1492601 [Mycena rebaudengoi]|nr:hypothetical protein C8J57DRAFT_1492601 [Mycena rebaudengoi]